MYEKKIIYTKKTLFRFIFFNFNVNNYNDGLF